MVHKQGTKGGKGGRKLSQSLSSPMGTPRGEERQLPLLAGNSSSSRPLLSRKASSCTLSPSIPALPTSSTSPPQPQVAKASNQGHTTSAHSLLPAGLGLLPPNPFQSLITWEIAKASLNTFLSVLGCTSRGRRGIETSALKPRFARIEPPL